MALNFIDLTKKEILQHNKIMINKFRDDRNDFQNKIDTLTAESVVIRGMTDAEFLAVYAPKIDKIKYQFGEEN